jgi:hypothetical protein
MSKQKIISQLSTSHSSQQRLDITEISKKLKSVHDALNLSILILGSHENSEVFNQIFQNKSDYCSEVYLWYNLLSDFEGHASTQTVVNYQGKKSEKWDGWEQSDVQESFVFACPNQPDIIRLHEEQLESILRKYPFDGIFLDKLRFPSPASSLEMTFSCFCPYCQEKAEKQNLDLLHVKTLLGRESIINSINFNHWMEAESEKKSLLSKYFKFRNQSIADLVAAIRKICIKNKVSLGLDLFTPYFSNLVGQNYRQLCDSADWIKPMIYRYALGPAGIRLEMRELINSLRTNYGFSSEEIFQLASRISPDLTPDYFSKMINDCVPFSFIEKEIMDSINFSHGKPVYIGIETVSFPGVIDIKPDHLFESLQFIKNSQADGVVLSWDLFHTPIENIEFIKKIYEQ